MMITRRKVLLAAGIGLLVAPRLGQGQTGAAIRLVGWLSFSSEATGAHLLAAFIALRVVASAPAQFGSAVEEILRQRAQAIVVVSDPCTTPSARSCKHC
jgi:hypothetical protein